jgi:hypothetical protein
MPVPAPNQPEPVVEVPPQPDRDLNLNHIAIDIPAENPNSASDNSSDSDSDSDTSTDTDSSDSEVAIHPTGQPESSKWKGKEKEIPKDKRSASNPSTAKGGRGAWQANAIASSLARTAAEEKGTADAAREKEKERREENSKPDKPILTADEPADETPEYKLQPLQVTATFHQVGTKFVHVSKLPYTTKPPSSWSSIVATIYFIFSFMLFTIGSPIFSSQNPLWREDVMTWTTINCFLSIVALIISLFFGHTNLRGRTYTFTLTPPDRQLPRKIGKDARSKAIQNQKATVAQAPKVVDVLIKELEFNTHFLWRSIARSCWIVRNSRVVNVVADAELYSQIVNPTSINTLTDFDQALWNLGRAGVTNTATNIHRDHVFSDDRVSNTVWLAELLAGHRLENRFVGSDLDFPRPL